MIEMQILAIPLSVKDIWLDDENDLIRSCGALSKVIIISINIDIKLLYRPPQRPLVAKTVLITHRALSVIHQALGLQKSFSTSDILSGAAYHEG